jgi:hypothetical protein
VGGPRLLVRRLGSPQGSLGSPQGGGVPRGGSAAATIPPQRDRFRSALARALGYGERAQQKLMDPLLVEEVMS